MIYETLIGVSILFGLIFPKLVSREYLKKAEQIRGQSIIDDPCENKSAFHYAEAKSGYEVSLIKLMESHERARRIAEERERVYTLAPLTEDFAEKGIQIETHFQGIRRIENHYMRI